MSDRAERSVFDSYATPRPSVVASNEESGGKRPYQAFTLGKERRAQSRLRLHYHDGSIGLLAYVYLQEVLWDHHHSTHYLTLFYTSCVIEIEGERLAALMDALQGDKVRTLTCFHAKRYQSPEAGAPVIKRMERKSVQDVVR